MFRVLFALFVPACSFAAQAADAITATWNAAGTQAEVSATAAAQSTLVAVWDVQDRGTAFADWANRTNLVFLSAGDSTNFVYNVPPGWGAAVGAVRLMLVDGTPGLPYDARYEYVESTVALGRTDGPYVDTGIQPCGSTRIRIDFQLPGQRDGQSASVGICGVRQNSGQKLWSLFAGKSRSVVQWDYMTQGDGNTHTGGLSFDLSQRNVFDLNANVFSVNGAAATQDFTGYTFSSVAKQTRPMYLFANNNGGSVQLSAPMRVWRFSCWEGVVPVSDYVPAQSNGVVGFYDEVQRAFRGSAASAQFSGVHMLDRAGTGTVAATTPAHGLDSQSLALRAVTATPSAFGARIDWVLAATNAATTATVTVRYGTTSAEDGHTVVLDRCGVGAGSGLFAGLEPETDYFAVLVADNGVDPVCEVPFAFTTSAFVERSDDGMRPLAIVSATSNALGRVTDVRLRLAAAPAYVACTGTVWMVSGNVWGGDTFGDWSVRTLVRNVTDGDEVVFDYTLPTGFGETYSFVRFFFVPPVYTSASYRPADALTHQYDGLDSGGRGQQALQTGPWCDLAGDVDLAPQIYGSTPSSSISSNALHCTGVNIAAQGYRAFTAAEVASVEIRLLNASPSQYAYLFSAGPDSVDRRLVIAYWSYIGYCHDADVTRSRLYDAEPMIHTSAEPFTFALSYANAAAYVEGVPSEKSAKQQSFGGAASGASVGGRNSGSGNNFAGDLFALRTYSRSLTDDEAAHNAHVDRVRYDYPAAMLTTASATLRTAAIFMPDCTALFVTGLVRGDAATVSSLVSEPGGPGACSVVLEVSSKGDFSDVVSVPVSGTFAVGARFSADVTGLAAGTTYRVRARLTNVASGAVGVCEPVSFTTASGGTVSNVEILHADGRRFDVVVYVDDLGVQNRMELQVFATDVNGGTNFAASAALAVTEIGQYALPCVVPTFYNRYEVRLRRTNVMSGGTAIAAETFADLFEPVDRQTYTWCADAGGVWDGAWFDRAHWTCSGDGYGVPSNRAASVAFAAGTRATIAAAYAGGDEMIFYSGFDVCTPNLDLVFRGNGSSYCALHANVWRFGGDVTPAAADSTVTFDAVSMRARWCAVRPGPNGRIVLRNGAQGVFDRINLYNTSTRHSGALLVADGSAASVSTLVMGDGGRAVVSNAALSVSTLRFGECSIDDGGCVELAGARASLFVAGEAADGLGARPNPGRFVFSVPVKGYDGVPLTGGSDARPLGVSQWGMPPSGIEIAVSDVSPAVLARRRTTVQLVAWPTGIETNKVILVLPSVRGASYRYSDYADGRPRRLDYVQPSRTGFAVFCR